MKDADIAILEKIIDYTDFVRKSIKHYRITQKTFRENALYQLALSNLIGQIGELCKHLSEETTNTYPHKEWRLAAKTREKIFHHYEDMDSDILWETAKESLPKMEHICSDILRENGIRYKPQNIFMKIGMER